MSLGRFLVKAAGRGEDSTGPLGQQTAAIPLVTVKVAPHSSPPPSVSLTPATSVLKAKCGSIYFSFFSSFLYCIICRFCDYFYRNSFGLGASHLSFHNFLRGIWLQCASWMIRFKLSKRGLTFRCSQGKNGCAGVCVPTVLSSFSFWALLELFSTPHSQVEPL